MDSIGHFEEVKLGFQNLNYNDKTRLDKLSRQLIMLIENILPEKPQYIDSFKLLKFKFLSIYMNNSDQLNKWNIDTEKTINLIDTIIEELKYFPKDAQVSVISQKQKHCDSSKIFIVHGHDDGAKETVARFVDKLGFKAVILHEQVDSGDTIIEKLEKHTDVGFAIVLYTECDIGGIKSSSIEDLTPRARQNVIFEHGLLIGKIGRANVVALVKGDVEIPNDISGVVYKSMDTGGSWKYSIAREMKSSSYDVDMNKID